MTSFGLRNQNGSCWVNATLQALFRIPEFQRRLGNEEMSSTPLESSIQEIWGSKGDEGLKRFYENVKSALLPAGAGIGDSHELLEYICDKIPFLDQLVRFKVGIAIECVSCKATTTKQDSMIEFSISSEDPEYELTCAMSDACKKETIADWVCEKCTSRGCSKQLKIAEFPSVLVFHNISKNKIKYAGVIIVNGIRYALVAVVCFDGGHWFTYGRNLPIGSSWFTYNDTHVIEHDGKQFPLSKDARLLMYSRLEE